MRKHEELYDPSSCLNKAKAGEMLFVLLSRDEAAPATIRHWCHTRVWLGLNKIDDKQIIDALECARIMEEEMSDTRGRTHPTKEEWDSLIANGIQKTYVGVAEGMRQDEIEWANRQKNPDCESGSSSLAGD